MSSGGQEIDATYTTYVGNMLKCESWGCFLALKKILLDLWNMIKSVSAHEQPDSIQRESYSLLT